MSSRTFDTLCLACNDVTAHIVDEDPALCTCSRCGADQTLMVPVA